MSLICPINFLKDLVSFKSISGTDASQIVDFLKRFFEDKSFDTTIIKDDHYPQRQNLLCTIGPNKPGGLMLSGHMDVVPVTGQVWQTDPFLLEEQSGKLLGRGVCDMKGFIAATCAAVNNINPKNLTKPLMLLWTFDEEIGCLGSLVVANRIKTILPHLPSAALLGEPTGFDILNMHAGHVTIKIDIAGKGAHSSDPSLGASAIKGLNNVLLGLFELEDQLKKEVDNTLVSHFKNPYVTLNVGQISGGSAVNIIPDHAEVTVGFRPLPTSSIDDIIHRIKTAALRYQKSSKVKISTAIVQKAPPMLTKPGSKLEDILRPLAHNKEIFAAQFTTDGGYLSQAGIPCLIFGPGSIDVAHQANEWIYKSDIFLAQEKIANIIKMWNNI